MKSSTNHRDARSPTLATLQKHGQAEYRLSVPPRHTHRLKTGATNQGAAILLLLGVFGAAADAREAAPLGPSATAAAMEQQIDWSRARLLSVQQGNRYKTLESFSREAIAAMYGKEHLPGLSPIASVLEWLFNAPPYVDIPLVRVKEAGLRVHLSAHMADAARLRLTQTGFMTPRELFDPVVLQRLDELEPRFDTSRAAGRVRLAEIFCKQMPRFMQIVPTDSDDPSALWLTPDAIRSNAAVALLDRANPDMRQMEQIAQRFGTPAMNFKNPDAAAVIVGAWQQLSEGWQARDAKKVQAALDRLTEVLPAQAKAGVYPSEAQRRGETKYYVSGKFAWGYWLYLLGAVVGVLAYVTRWRIPWWATVALLVGGLAVHTYGVALRWMILGRIPNANLFEALTFASWGVVAIALLLALWYRAPLYLLAANITGFVALVIAHFGIQGGGNITPIMGILDDIMLRIHTSVITISYVLVFLAGVLGAVYVYGYSLVRNPARAIEAAALVALGGAALLVATMSAVSGSIYVTNAATSLPALRAGVSPLLWGIAGGAVLVLAVALVLMRRRGMVRSSREDKPAEALEVRTRGSNTPYAALLLGALVVAIVFGTLAGLPHWAAQGTGWSLLAGGLAWAIMTGIGWFILNWMRGRGSAILESDGGVPAQPLGLVPGYVGASAIQGLKSLATGVRPPGEKMGRAVTAMAGNLVRGGAGDGPAPATAGRLGRGRYEARPLMAGASPGDERERLPQWLIDCDWMHLIVLNLIFVLLFVGTILGAVWADYSWGRPWGWDPKEVFALNTWIVYVILIHIRFVVKKRGLWTAWLSVAGTSMMAFNWWVVNHYIVGLHSYA